MEIDNDVGEVLEDDLPVTLFSCSYEEAPSSEDFFVPYCWTVCVKSAPEIAWNLSTINLFDARKFQGNSSVDQDNGKLIDRDDMV